jgi:hypothetical protein
LEKNGMVAPSEKSTTVSPSRIFPSLVVVIKLCQGMYVSHH